MPVEFKSFTIAYNSSRQRQFESKTILFDGVVQQAAALLKGFTIDGIDEDQSLSQIGVNLELQDNAIDGNTVTVTCQLIVLQKSTEFFTYGIISGTIIAQTI